MLIIEQASCQSLCKLRFADARGAEEHERAYRPVRVGDAGTRTLDGLSHETHGLVLADDPLVDDLVEVQQLLALALDQFRDRDAGPFSHDVCDLLLRDRVVHERVLGGALLGALLGLGELLLKGGQVGVLELCGLLVLEGHLRGLDLAVDALDLALYLLDLVHAAALGFPARLHGVEFVLELRKLSGELRKTVLGELVVLLLEGHLLDLELHDLSAQVVQLAGHGVYLRPDHGAGLIHEVYGLVGQETVRYIAVRQRRGGDKRVVVDADAMEYLIALLQAAEYAYRVLDRRLVDHDGLETTLQSRVLFDVLAVLVQGRGADAVQLAARQHGLQEVARVHAALGLARADDGVQLIDEQDYPALGAAYLLQHGLEPLLKLAAVLGARDERAHVEREDGLVLQPVRHVAADYTLSQALGYGRLADAGFADEHGVVLRLTREDADDVPYLAVTADDGVELLLTRALHEVGAVFRQGVVAVLRVVAGHGAGLDLGECGVEGFARDAVVGEYLAHRRAALGEHAEHQVLDGDVLVAQLLRRLLGKAQQLARLGGGVDLAAAAGDLGQLGDLGVQLTQHGVAVRTHLGEQRADEAAVLVDKGVEQVSRGEVLVLVLLSHRLSGVYGFNCLLSEFFSVHKRSPSFRWAECLR